VSQQQVFDDDAVPVQPGQPVQPVQPVQPAARAYERRDRVAGI
jgi:hypothetical protein